MTIIEGSDPPAPKKHLHQQPVKICMLASGSKGNSIYISTGKTSVLIDAGLPGVEIERRMASQKISISEIDAIIVSHEHSDHIKGVGILARKHNLPVFISNKTKKAAALQLGRVDIINLFSCGSEFAINGLAIRPFSTSHDADDPAGFTIKCGEKKIGVATDLGIATAMVKEHLKGCACIVLEANHDLRMLEDGPYPWPLKQRIKSRTGHLSNESSRELLMEVMHDGLSHVILAHLSETNNTPEKALSVVSQRLNRHHLNLSVALQQAAGPIISL
jgi:phosphoribosyl 1,2-cyclic phosphodiesterase